MDSINVSLTSLVSEEVIYLVGNLRSDEWTSVEMTKMSCGMGKKSQTDTRISALPFAPCFPGSGRIS